MIEVQCGDYLGEDDIVRFDDIYGRVRPASDRAADERRSARPADGRRPDACRPRAPRP